MPYILSRHCGLAHGTLVTCGRAATERLAKLGGSFLGVEVAAG
jgi:hypothetical protein